MITIIQEEPYIVFEASRGTTFLEVLDFLSGNDLPAKMGFFWGGTRYVFCSQKEREYFSLGIEMVLNTFDSLINDYGDES